MKKNLSCLVWWSAMAVVLATALPLRAESLSDLTLFGITFARHELVTINSADGSGVVVGSLGEESFPYGIAVRNGRLYTFDQSTNRIREINKIDGRFTRSINIGVTGLKGEGDLAFRPSDGVGFLASALNSDSEPVNDFYTFTITDNTDVGVAVRLGSTGVPIDALAFDSNGTLYGIGQASGNLYTINQTTGAATVVGPLGVTMNSPVAGMTFAPANVSSSANGDLYAAIDDRLYRVNTATGTATKVSSAVINFGPNVSSVAGLAFSTGAGILGNMSARVVVGTDDNVAIVGFIIQGSPDKRIVVRGIGPNLTTVANPLADPFLQLFDGQQNKIAENDDFASSPEKQQITDLGLAPGNAKESAILRTLAPGAYTAVLRGANSGTGVGLVEVYDVDTGSGSELANLSARAAVQLGDNVLIGGLIVNGSAPQRIVVRAIGPDLANSGVANPLNDPMVELFDSNGTLLKSNDNYPMDPDATEIAARSLAPHYNRESATLVTLDPGLYTAIVRGVNNTTGVALVESFNITGDTIPTATE